MTGINVGSVFFDVGLNNKTFKKGILSAGKFAEASLGAVFSKIGKLALAAFSIKAITKFASSAIGLASDLAEVQNVIDVTFGQGNKKIEAFAQSAVTSFGLSELSAKQYMGTMGAMLKSMGLSSDAVETMSTDMVGLAGDMASFYNLDGDEAFSKIRAGISGETEPLKQLGINMSVANMEAFALSQGITKSYNAMTQAEQALLRYNYLMSVTSDAQGDFARTSDGWANQVRVLKLQWDSFKASLGSAFITALTPVIQWLNVLMGKMIAAANTFKSFVNAISGNKTQSATSGAAAGVAAIGAAAEEAGEQAADGAKKAKGALASFDELNTLSSDSDSGSDSAAEVGGSDSAASDVPALLPEGTDTKFSALFDAISNLSNSCTTTFGPAITTFFETALGPLVSWLGEKLTDAIIFVSGLFESWCMLFQNNSESVNSFAGLLGEVVAAIWLFMEPLADGVWEIFKGVIEIISTIFQGLFQWILDNQEIVVAALVAIVAAMAAYKAVVGISSLIDLFKSGIIATTVAENAAAVAQWALNAAMSANPIGLVVAAITGLVAAFVLLWNKCEGFRNFWKALWEGIKTVMQVAWNIIKAILSGIANCFIAIINGITSAINLLIKGINLISFDVPDWVPGLGGKKLGFNIPLIPKIPYLAKGGIVDQPTLSMIGEAGKEAVVPLENNTGWMDKMSSTMRADEILAVLKEILDALRSGKVVELDKRVVGQVITNILESSFRAAGKTTLSV